MSAGAPRLFLIDTFGLIFRAFYGRARSGAPLMRTSAGLPTEAIYIFNNMMRKLVETHRPDYLAAVWEGAGPTFRDEIFEDYKANRDETPDDLLLQLPYVERLLESVNIPVLACDGYEADDVIGTLAKQAAGRDIEVYVVSSDKDLTQLVNDHVYMLDPMKGDLLYDPDKVKEVQGVAPEQIVDLLALKGDSVDNIPGAPGIGDKGARDLIETYGGVEGAIEHAAEVKRKTYRESLQQNRDQILMSKVLATIARDAPIELDLDSLEVARPNVEALAELYRELEFNSLLSQLQVPEGPAKVQYRTLQSPAEFTEWFEQNTKSAPRASVAFVVDLPAAGERKGGELDTGEFDPGGVAFSAAAGEAVLLPTPHLDAAKPYLEDPARPKRVHDLKTAMHQLAPRGIELAGVTDDSMLAAFLLDASRNDYSLERRSRAISAWRSIPTSAARPIWCVGSVKPSTARSTRRTFAISTKTSSCRWRRSSPAWSAPASFSIPRSSAGSRKTWSASSSRSERRSTASPGWPSTSTRPSNWRTYCSKISPCRPRRAAARPGRSPRRPMFSRALSSTTRSSPTSSNTAS